MRDDWDVIARLPWEQKEQRARAAFLDPANEEQRAVMRRNIDLHHRSATLQGVSDLMLLGRRRWHNVRRDGDAVILSGGLTIPTGRTIENPYRLGDRGIQHLHIQFGTGTIDPLLEGSYSTPLPRAFSGGAYFGARLPFYENRRTFRGPPEVSLGILLSHDTTERFQLRAEAGAFVQGDGSWDGERDENTGLLATSVTVGATVRASSIYLAADARFPLSQRTLDEGDAFEQGPTFVIGVAARLR